MVQQHLAARLDHQVLGREGDVAVVDELDELAVLEPEGGIPDADDVLFGQHLAGNLLAVDEGAVMAAEVDDLVAAGGRFAQFRVPLRHVEVGKDQVVVGHPADAHGLGRQRHPRRGPAVHARQQVGRHGRGRPGGRPRHRVPRGVLTLGRRGPAAGRRGLGFGSVRTGQAGRGGGTSLRGRRPPGFGAGAGFGFLDGRSGRGRQGRAGMVGGGRTWRDGRGSLGHAAQDRPVVRVAQPDHALGADLDPVEPLQAEERAVGAAEVLDNPGVPVNPQHPVLP